MKNPHRKEAKQSILLFCTPVFSNDSFSFPLLAFRFPLGSQKQMAQKKWPYWMRTRSYFAMAPRPDRTTRTDIWCWSAKRRPPIRRLVCTGIETMNLSIPVSKRLNSGSFETSWPFFGWPGSICRIDSPVRRPTRTWLSPKKRLLFSNWTVSTNSIDSISNPNRTFYYYVHYRPIANPFLFLPPPTVRPLKVQIIGPKHPINAGERVTLVCESEGSRPNASISFWTRNENYEDNYIEKPDYFGRKSIKDSWISSTLISSDFSSKLTLLVNESYNNKQIICRAEHPILPDSAIEDVYTLNVRCKLGRFSKFLWTSKFEHGIEIFKILIGDIRDPNQLIKLNLVISIPMKNVQYKTNWNKMIANHRPQFGDDFCIFRRSSESLAHTRLEQLTRADLREEQRDIRVPCQRQSDADLDPLVFQWWANFQIKVSLMKPFDTSLLALCLLVFLRLWVLLIGPSLLVLA